MTATAAPATQSVALRGRLDASTVPEVRELLHAAVDTGERDLVVDLSAVDRVDATGIGVLLGTHRRAGQCGRRMVLRGVAPRTARLLRATRLNGVLHLEPPAVRRIPRQRLPST